MAGSDPFEPIELFSLPIFTTMVPGFEAHRKPLLDEILDHQRRFAGLRRSNRGAWHSGDEFLQLRSEHLGFVLQNVVTYAKGALGRYYANWATQEIRLGTYWANVVGPGGFNAPHHHYPQHWSGVFYVAMPEAAGGDDLAGMIEFQNPVPWQSLWGRGGNYGILPKQGMTVLFPSPLLHFVHPHPSDQNRVSIAYNFSVVPKARS